MAAAEPSPSSRCRSEERDSLRRVASCASSSRRGYSSQHARAQWGIPQCCASAARRRRCRSKHRAKPLRLGLGGARQARWHRRARHPTSRREPDSSSGSLRQVILGPSRSSPCATFGAAREGLAGTFVGEVCESRLRRQIVEEHRHILPRRSASPMVNIRPRVHGAVGLLLTGAASAPLERRVESRWCR